MVFSQILILILRENGLRILKHLTKRLTSNIACSGGNLHGGKPEKGG